MFKIFASKSSNNKNGVLLPDGDRASVDMIIAMLKKHGNGDLKLSVDSAMNQSVATFSIAQALEKRINIHNDHSLQYSKMILSTIIDTSKTKSWWMLANALGNYVDWLYTHSIDVAIISIMIAVELEYSNEELWNLGLGAFLHDIGKLMIPKDIIQKPGSLTDIEINSMRQHCELGLNLLEPFSLSKECTDIVLQHHERLDGSGYPNGLKEDEICRSAKIVMIADAVDAITSVRPYKQPKEIDTAIRILRSDEEKYSKELVDLLQNMLG